MTAQERLRQAREAKGWTLSVLAEKTGVREPMLALVDRGAFSELPTGVRGRFAVRAYASSVGLDPHQILAEVEPLLATFEDPLDGLARVKGISRRPQPAEQRRETARPECVSPGLEATAGRSWRSLAAASVDALLLAVIACALVPLTALAADTGVKDVLVVASPALLMLLALIWSLYFVVLGGLGNQTLGTRLLQVKLLEPAPGAIDARVALARGLRCALRETSFVVEWLVSTDQVRHWLRALRFRRVRV